MNMDKNGLDTTVKYELPVQAEIPAVISVPRAEMYSNALLFYDAFRGLCRLRIDYAENKANKMLISAQLSDPDEAERLFQKEKFWLKVKDYWKARLELSYKWEKDYFGRK
jgi:hypothetical protein